MAVRFREPSPDDEDIRKRIIPGLRDWAPGADLTDKKEFETVWVSYFAEKPEMQENKDALVHTFDIVTRTVPKKEFHEERKKVLAKRETEIREYKIKKVSKYEFIGYRKGTRVAVARFMMKRRNREIVVYRDKQGRLARVEK